MRKILFIGCLLFVKQAICQSSEPVIWLQNNSGIVEDNSGSVTLWENQIIGDVNGYGDATSDTSAEGAEQSQETYPGKVNVAFVNNLSHMDINDSNKYIVDNEFSVFYVGKTGDVGSVAVLLGNFRVDNGNWGTCSGVRFTRKNKGELAIQYGRPSYKQIVLNTLPEDEFFFFGFSVDATGSYRYFDNSSPNIKTGTLDGSILQNNDDMIMNLARQADADYTYFHTEVAEVSVYDEKLSETEFQNEFDRLSADYSEIVKKEFTVSQVVPSSRVDISKTDNIAITFSQEVDVNSVLPKVYVNKSNVEYPGTWNVSSSTTLSFTPDSDWPYASLITVKLNENLVSTDNVALGLPKFKEYNFIVESENNFGGVENITVPYVALVDHPQVGHTLPMKLNLPVDRSNKVPVHIWVHGGGWSGGSLSSSVADTSPHGAYLAKNLGIATLGISYRCHGSNGNFTLAMEDVAAAYQWAVDHADTYNFDMTKVFFSGGSAGTPLAALSAQRFSSTIGFIGFNGVYDFVNDQGSFGQWNGYGQENPSAEANSAIFQLRANPPATILMHGDADTTILLSQSTLFSDKIVAEGGDAETIVYPGEVHAFFNLNQPEYEDVLYEMANFIQDQLNISNSLSIGGINIESSLGTVLKNPISQGEYIMIELNIEAEVVHTQFVNSIGQTVLHNDIYLNSKELAISTDNLSSGIYMLKISTKNYSINKKIIIQ